MGGTVQKARGYKLDQRDYALDANCISTDADSAADSPSAGRNSPDRQLLRKMLIAGIALVPLNLIRIFLYRVLLGYDIDYQSRVGMFSYLHLGSCQMRGARIGSFNMIRAKRLIMAPGSFIYRFNRIQDVNVFSLGKESLIRSRNSFIATAPGSTPFKHLENFRTGSRCLITNGHFFDLSDEIRLGDNVTFGGLGSQVWTHGVSVDRVRMQAPVELESHIYLGSRSLIVQGVHIGERVVVGAGTVVSKSLEPGTFYVSTSVERKGPFQDYANHPGVLTHRGNAFLRKNPW